MLYRRLLKRVIDFTASFVMLVVLSPAMVVITLLLCIFNSGNPFFTQQRPGKDRKVFYLVKFRTMNDKRDTQGNLLSDKDRLTSIGKFIRSTSLDELPQLINVLKGDMTLIGPRPLLVKYLPLYNEQQARRHEVRPGITGWAQVNGRNAIAWQQRFELDVYYVDNVSFWLDMKIVYLTVKKVLKREGIQSSESVTMEAFKGK